MMKFKIFGVQVYISFLFAAYITLLLIIDKTGLIIPVLISNAIHELGHATAMNFVKCRIIKILLTPGGCIMTVPPFKNKKDEITVALAGPLFNFIASAVFVCFWLAFKLHGCFVAAAINGGLCAFNLLAIKGLDADTVLYILLEDKKPVLYKLLNIIFSVAFCAFCIFGFLHYGINTSVIVVALYLICCAVFKI